MAKITEYLEVYTKEYLLNLALAEVPDDVDKEQGSIINDTLSIVCAKMADVFVEIKQIVEQSYIITATNNDNIDYRVAERGITRYPATKARRLGIFTYTGGSPATIQIGSLFSTIDENRANVLNYNVVGEYIVDGNVIPGSYILECETEGTAGNTYYGEILPLTDMDTLGSATLTTVLQPARDVEDNDSVKERYYETFELKAFGGNFTDYYQYLANFTGVGQAQLYPRTQLDERIVISCLDPSNQPISEQYQNEIKAQLDPENYYNNGNNTEGMGLGVIPMGHLVTITTPTETEINVEVQIIKDNLTDLNTVTQNITQNVTNYIKQVQDQWDNGRGEYTLSLYYNRVLATVMESAGVINAPSCLVNGDTVDLTFEQNRNTQTIPKLGTVTVSEVTT